MDDPLNEERKSDLEDDQQDGDEDRAYEYHFDEGEMDNYDEDGLKDSEDNEEYGLETIKENPEEEDYNKNSQSD